MKATRFATLMALGTALSFIAVGCQPQNLHKIPPNQIPAPEVPIEPPIQPPTILPPEGGPGSTNIPLSEFPGHTNWLENADQFKADTVYFAFDSSVVRSADKSKVAAVADYLKQNAQAAVRVEGNCDERGTEEYNRSLGERRALAAREELVGLGITPDRVDTISYGEDKPVDPGHNEAAWKKNRRDDFILLTPPK
jgi:peptidoglycan-associated lipoprotein